MAITARLRRPICLMAGQGNKLHCVLENAFGFTTAMYSTQKAIELGKPVDCYHSSEFAWTDGISALSSNRGKRRDRNVHCGVSHRQVVKHLPLNPDASLYFRQIGRIAGYQFQPFYAVADFLDPAIIIDDVPRRSAFCA